MDQFYIHYGRVEVVAQVAPGTGIVSSAVLLSDDLDEIDLEIQWKQHRDTVPKGQNNYYGKVCIPRTRQTGLPLTAVGRV